MVWELLGLDAENRVFDTVLMGRKTWQVGVGTTNPYPQALWPEIDRLVVKVNPVVIGAGVKLFDGGEFEVRKLELVDHQIYRSGVAVLSYKSFASKGDGAHS